MKKFWKVWKRLSLALLLGIASLAMLTVYADGGGQTEWTTDALSDFAQGTIDGVDVWSNPGTARLDYLWPPNARVNDLSDQSKFSPRLSFVLTNTGGLTETVFLAVWADERAEDHYPDIYFARSADGGLSWSSDVLVSGAHQNGRGKNTPGIAVRLSDESFWVVWQDNRNDDGDIYYALSNNKAQTGEAPHRSIPARESSFSPASFRMGRRGSFTPSGKMNGTMTATSISAATPPQPGAPR